MAHQKDKIPWDLLSSNFHWAQGTNSGKRNCTPTNIRPRMKENQAMELAGFVDDFAKTVDISSTLERKKYPTTYLPQDPADVLIDDILLQKIRPAVRRWAAENETFQNQPAENWTRRLNNARRISDFLYDNNYENYRMNAEWYNWHSYFSLNVIKTLIIHNEMDPILRMCAHPDIKLGSWLTDDVSCKPFLWARFMDVGWNQLYQRTLRIYICLNLAYGLPEMWNEAAGKTEDSDYRHTLFYQRIVRDSTTYLAPSVLAHLPRAFFGIGDNQFPFPEPTIAKEHEIHRKHWLRRKLDIHDRKGERIIKNHYGLLPFDEFLTLEAASLEYMPTPSDATSVQLLLMQRWRLPAELARDIMELANYKPKRILKVAHDPLHPLNRAEFIWYLDQCWQILINCDMMAKAIGVQLKWKEEVDAYIAQLLRDDHYQKDDAHFGDDDGDSDGGDEDSDESDEDSEGHNEDSDEDNENSEEDDEDQEEHDD